ncbi:tannase [Colletotrichum higginsianum]|uniref:Carboxylic ester hydrolase n=2 Tax=Colletotrichum higginsianum TaxID=80884 RepID=H1V054_COLHI|nr:Carboxylic ester hydrolase [Colletotrichum higginsianum IMI 349063]OBR03133.1 Carboxylic ester hydrolase [Colletotrichum higginsianum IMI 349063]CCF33605.1 tannase [Colletotrichum higginsianum]
MSASLFRGTISPSACSADTFSYPIIPGVRFLSLEANFVENLTSNVFYYPNHGPLNVTSARFCNVSTTYTHPGGNDSINVQVWLPTDTWNGRLQGIGGGGWSAGLPYQATLGMTAAVGEGYATFGTDAGLDTPDNGVTPERWAWGAGGEPNMRLLENLASASLYEGAVVAKNFTAAFYAEPAKYSYFSGCSQGGRQGMALAQRYPDLFDGIAAAAPAINWNSLFVGGTYANFLMNLYGMYPPSCEVEALTAAAIEACDGLDGVVDGILSDPGACDFDPVNLVGTTIKCAAGPQANGSGNGSTTERKISLGAATIVQKTWDGPRRANNSRMWYGPGQEATLVGGIYPNVGGSLAPIGTNCSANSTCTLDPLVLFQEWIRFYVLKNPTADTSKLSLEEFEEIFDSSAREYRSMIDTSNPDLSAFRQAGGKLITYHGTADELIPFRGSVDYYQRVTKLDPNVHDFYRLFLAPGLYHCIGGPGPYPDTTFDSLVQWVENGVAPDSLLATSVGTDPIIQRPLCPYPQKQKFLKTLNGTENFICE